MGSLATDSAGVPTHAGVRLKIADAIKQAQLLFEKGDFDKAEKLARAVLERRANQAHMTAVIAGVAEKRGDRERAVQILNDALTGAPTDALALMNLCRLHRMAGRLDEARSAGERAVATGSLPEALVDLADTFSALGDNARALALLERAVAARPNLARAHLGLAQTLLLKGEFRAGWTEYEWRYRLPSTINTLPKFRQPQWNGMPLSTSALLVIAEQGYGDCFQFARYLPRVCERVGKVYVGAGPNIIPVLQTLKGAFTCFERWEQIPQFDFQITMSSLPLVFGTTLESVPADVPYLAADAGKAARWRERLAGPARGRKTVGFVWQGRPTHPNDRNRSIGLSAMTPLLEMDGILPVSLQMDEARAQLQAHAARERVFDAAAELSDFADTAALIANLDCVVTIDSAIAHLTGALGRPGLVMLPFAGEWRWLEGRTDSPWYPTLTLVRQRERGNWDDVIGRVVERLAA